MYATAYRPVEGATPVPRWSAKTTPGVSRMRPETMPGWLGERGRPGRETGNVGCITTLCGRGETNKVVVVNGEIMDPPDAAQLYEVVRGAVEPPATTVEIDLDGVNLFGAAGIRALLEAEQEASRLGCSVSVVAASPLVRRVLQVTSLTERFRLPEG